MIYMDNAATTAVRKEVAEAMLPYLLGDYGNPSGVYRLSEKAKNVVEESRDIIADIINADRNEIFFTSGGTEGDNWAVKAESLKTGTYNSKFNRTPCGDGIGTVA